MARFTPKSSRPSISIIGEMPLVEIVCRFGEMESPSMSLIILIAFVTHSKLSSGSPIPIYTIFTRFWGGMSLSLLIATICSTISPVVRLRLNPPSAVLQNLHPILHPICELTQMLHFSLTTILPFSSLCDSRICIRTDSKV